MSQEFRFAWPASAIRRGHEMALLYRVRESSPERTPITQLIANAINHTYGHLTTNQPDALTNLERNPNHVPTQARVPGHHLEKDPAARPAA